MLEIRGGKDLKYSSELPAWSRYVHYAIIGFLGIIALAIFSFGMYLLIYESDWIFSFILAGLGIFIGWICWILIGVTRFQHEVIMKIELREDGFFTSVQNLKTGKLFEELVPFAQMDEVLIGRIFRYVQTPKNVPRYYIAGAKIIMVWTDEQGKRQFGTFGEEKQENLDLWIERFRQNGVPVYNTQLNITQVNHPQLSEAYEQIPKLPYDGESPYFQTGLKIYDPTPEWKSTEMLANEEAKKRRNDVRFFRPLFIGVIVFNFLVALLWMPGWGIEDELFNDASPSTAITLGNVALLFLARTYWRKKARWYRPLVDTLIMFAVHAMGVSASLLNAPLQEYVYDALFVENFTMGVFLGGAYFITRLFVYRIIR